MANWVELRAKSFFSYGEGASHAHELLAQAKQFGYPALALTDTNLCGALEFARLAKSLGTQPITGGELTLTDGSKLALLAKTRAGYSNISRLFTLANADDRRDPKLDPSHLPDHCEGVVLLTGGRDGPLSQLAMEDRFGEAHGLLRQYFDWYGPNSVYVELQQNFLAGDTDRNRKLIRLAADAGAQVVATNDVHYHTPDRARLQQALVAAKLNTTIDQALRFLRPNHHLHLKPPAEMERLFADCPQAVSNTLRIAEQCCFDLSTDLGYALPDAAVPPDSTPLSYLERLCREGAVRRYGSVTSQVEDRLAEEFGLIERLNLAGFLLLYRQIALLGQQILVERGEISPDTPIEERPPGRGRGSSVALLVGYLIGISHVDPLKWDLTLERFISEDMTTLPDIDLDFPRGLRDELIERVHAHFGPEHAVLAGAITTYKVKGIIQDLGKALGLPQERLGLLSKRLHSHHADDLRNEMAQLPEFKDKVDAPGWRDLLNLAPQLMGAPRGLGQHVGGMVLSSSPIPEMVPIRAGATEGRYIMDWDKDSVADASFAKIDILSLPVLDQIDEALDLVAEREGARPDLGQISPEDPGVYDMINDGLCKGVFLLQSPAQLKMAQRLKSRNLLDLAYQVALIRPGVGVQGSAVSQFVERYRHDAEWDYDHPLEKRALERGYGIIVWQEQVVQLIEDVAGMTASEADEVRRAFARPNSEHLIALHWERFAEGARQNGVPEAAAKRIFAKINGHYMFPESHSHAFAVTAYQAAWLKRYHPVEFFVALMNNQPMGFYPMETLKQDARRFGVPFLNPCVNQSSAVCSPEGGSVRLGLQFIKDVGAESAKLIVAERQRLGLYTSAGDLVRRTGLKDQAVLSLVLAGAFDAIAANRREALWESGLQNRPSGSGQTALSLSTDDRVPQLADFTEREKMMGEYRTMGMYPKGHLMEFLRPTLDPGVMPTAEVEARKEDEVVTVAGWPVARQHPHGRDGTVFVTIEDETGDTQVIIYSDLFARRRRELGSQVIVVTGRISRWDGTVNVVATDVRSIDPGVAMPPSHDWH
ncbi:MAG: DNA polymerase III subunit alpha [Acidimicrobiia bacterium]|nr:DNA polymerase III subunit alpha [Acidimicrobiia bacterium]MYG58027.1 DNA polymerase III subunit alpha [Acidimicrobiia bacterium]MYJ32516.1 DNA polymerase III subunit alpha [Acidimicrobiia bacterium]